MERQGSEMTLEKYEDLLDQFTKELAQIDDVEMTDEAVRAQALKIRDTVRARATGMGLSEKVVKKLCKDIPWGFIMRAAYSSFLDE